MPLPNLPVPAFPNVPILPGVPPLLRDANASVVNLVVGVQSVQKQILKILGVTAARQWGIFDANGAQIIMGNSVVSFDYMKEARVSDFPVEGGQFASYNKVDTPADLKMGFAVQGPQATRSEFLRNIDAQQKSLELLTAVSPDRSYGNMNVVHHDYRRDAKTGAKLMIVDVWLREIRIASDSAFTKTQDPQGADPKDDGTVQSTAVPAAVAAAREEILP